MSNTPLESLNLASISGIIVATMFAVEVLKRLFSTASWFSKIPTFVYAGVIAVGLAFAANSLKTGDGSPILEGNRWKLMWAALIGALGASGFYTWLTNPAQLRETRQMLKIIVLSSLAFMMVGCNCAEKAVLREGMDGSTRTIRSTQLDWARKLTTDPATGKDHRDEIKALTPEQLNQFEKAHQEYNDLVSEDRARG